MLISVLSALEFHFYEHLILRLILYLKLYFLDFTFFCFVFYTKCLSNKTSPSRMSMIFETTFGQSQNCQKIHFVKVQLIFIILFIVVKSHINPIALRMAKTPLSFGHSECNRVKSEKSSQYDRNVKSEQVLAYSETWDRLGTLVCVQLC